MEICNCNVADFFILPQSIMKVSNRKISYIYNNIEMEWKIIQSGISRNCPESRLILFGSGRGDMLFSHSIVPKQTEDAMVMPN